MPPDCAAAAHLGTSAHRRCARDRSTEGAARNPSCRSYIAAAVTEERTPPPLLHHLRAGALLAYFSQARLSRALPSMDLDTATKWISLRPLPKNRRRLGIGRGVGARISSGRGMLADTQVHVRRPSRQDDRRRSRAGRDVEAAARRGVPPRWPRSSGSAG